MTTVKVRKVYFKHVVMVKYLVIGNQLTNYFLTYRLYTVAMGATLKLSFKKI